MHESGLQCFTLPFVLDGLGEEPIDDLVGEGQYLLDFELVKTQGTSE